MRRSPISICRGAPLLLMTVAGGCMVPQTPVGVINPPPTPAASSTSTWSPFTRTVNNEPPPPPSNDDANIIGVRKFIMQEPWLSFSPDGLRQVDGFKATIYLESGTTGKGAFGDGNIRVSMYTVDREGGSEHLRLAVQWELTPEQTVPWRVKKATRLGWGYGLRLPWGDADVGGKEVEVVFQFLRKDGTVVSSEPIRLRVPARNLRVVSRDEASPRGADGAGPIAAPAVPTAPSKSLVAGQ